MNQDPARLRSGHGAKWASVPADVLPAWVADMDFGIPDAVRARIGESLERQDLGYPYWPGGDPVVAAFAERMRERYSWEPAAGRARVFSDLIQVLQVVIELTTRPGDAIAIHVPSYPPFLAAIQRAGRTIVALPLVEGGDGWSVDLDEHRRLLGRHRPRLFVLVSPHNPTGHVFAREELQGLAELAIEHRVPVLADEIHADLTYAPRRHTPFATLGDEAAELVVTATSATKAFNLAGTRCAVAHVGHRPTAEALERAPLDYFGTPGVLARIATVAAWRESDHWQRRVLEQLHANRARVAEWASGHPEVRYRSPDATYLAWLDFGATAIAHDPAGEILRRGRVQLSPGHEFSRHTELDTQAFARLNFATTRETLDRILGRVDEVLR